MIEYDVTGSKAYEICDRIVHMYAKDHKWSDSKKYRTRRTFSYEYRMSRLGSKDSNAPSIEVGVGYACGGKTVEFA